MKRKGKIANSANSSGKIIQSEVKTPEISFSFKYFDAKHPKFNIEKHSGRYFYKVIERLKAICDMKRAELQITKAIALRCHPIKWEATTVKSGFDKIPSHLKDSEPWQFQISSNEYGRAHGFFIDHIFFIVWLDYHHQLYY